MSATSDETSTTSTDETSTTSTDETSTSSTDETSTTSTDETSTTSTDTTDQTYTGGDKTISNYAGEEIIFDATYVSVDFSDDTFLFNSSSGTLTIQNAIDKIIDFRDGAGDVLAKAYAASSGGTIDGREYSGYQFIVGSTAGSNDIYAGSYGSTMWGNSGSTADTLTGGSGGDIFFVGKNDGNDVINDASSDDTVNLYDVNLSDITNVSENNGTITVELNTGNTLNIQSSDNLSARFNLADGSRWRYNRSTASWQNE